MLMKGSLRQLKLPAQLCQCISVWVYKTHRANPDHASMGNKQWPSCQARFGVLCSHKVTENKGHLRQAGAPPPHVHFLLTELLSLQLLSPHMQLKALTNKQLHEGTQNLSEPTRVCATKFKRSSHSPADMGPTH